MRLGTFECFMWGHKFIGSIDEMTPNGWYTKYKVLDFCVRCGIERRAPETAPASESQTSRDAKPREERE